jgi:hypothetical protein
MGGMSAQERFRLVMAVLPREPINTSSLKERAGLVGHRDPVYSILMAAVGRGEVNYHGKDAQGECVWSRA